MPEPSPDSNDLKAVLGECLNLESPRSFFLYAGAGSGKTRTLVEAMEAFRKQKGKAFRLSGRQVGVITYTNAARDEIKSRTFYDPIFAVSTIHSFAWELVQGFHQDIKNWLTVRLEAEIEDLRVKQQKGRAGTKAAAERAIQIEAKKKRLDRLGEISAFAYNPNGENTGKNSLNHAEVIGLAADFLTGKPLMQRILARKYPIMLIDESQDTQKDLLDAFFSVQSSHTNTFCLCLFGDTMQRIYSDGKVGLEDAVPDEWAKPAISVNHRCPKRVVRFINSIRAHADTHTQTPRDDAPEGFVRLFVAQDVQNKAAVEAKAAEMMSTITADELWSSKDENVRTLTLEHSMAARRGGFNDFFDPLYEISRFKTGLLDGTLSGVSFLSQWVLPLVQALRDGDAFSVARLVTTHSPLVSRNTLGQSDSPLSKISEADKAVKSLQSFWNGGTDPALIDVVREVANSRLFVIPDVLAPLIPINDQKDDGELGNDDRDPEISAWDAAMSAPFGQVEAYVRYISDESPYGTHQGIKGLEFPRVMVVLDDNEARGFMFSYDKLLGAKAPSKSDLKNADEGRETSIDRTRRLFYVTCSRAQSSLAIVLYTSNTASVMSHLKGLGWFDEGEIIVMDQD